MQYQKPTNYNIVFDIVLTRGYMQIKNPAAYRRGLIS
jgi:hypothetical protein